MLQFAANQLNDFIKVLKDHGYLPVAPISRDGAIIYDEIHSAGELPIGITDEQERGHYRLKERSDEAFFGYAVGPYSWKRFFDPPRRKLYSIDQKNMTVKVDDKEISSYALIGVRACELAAISIQDKVFTGDLYKNTYYREARQKALIVGVHCHSPAATCFCPSFDTGPEFKKGYDLLLTEVVGEEHFFILQWGSEKGEKIAGALSFTSDYKDQGHIDAQLESTRKKIERQVDPLKAREALKDNMASPLWNEVAADCTSCANCTLVCPTCFCSTVEDVVDLSGEHAERWKRWDSCFTQDFSYIHGGVVRESIPSRYRQWLTHKLSTWHDQFDSSGCVGCGRCVTWCPVGIDFTVGVEKFYQGDQ